MYAEGYKYWLAYKKGNTKYVTLKIQIVSFSNKIYLLQTFPDTFDVVDINRIVPGDAS